MYFYRFHANAIIFFWIFIFYMIILCDFLSCVLRLNELGGPKKRGSRTNFSILRILAELLFDLIWVYL